MLVMFKYTIIAVRPRLRFCLWEPSSMTSSKEGRRTGCQHLYLALAEMTLLVFLRLVTRSISLYKIALIREEGRKGYTILGLQTDELFRRVQKQKC